AMVFPIHLSNSPRAMLRRPARLGAGPPSVLFSFSPKGGERGSAGKAPSHAAIGGTGGSAPLSEVRVVGLQGRPAHTLRGGCGRILWREYAAPSGAPPRLFHSAPLKGTLELRGLVTKQPVGTAPHSGSRIVSRTRPCERGCPPNTIIITNVNTN